MNQAFVTRLAAELEEIRSAGLFKTERIISSPQGAEITVNNKTVLNFCANNYLGLSSHPVVLEAAKKYIDTRGFGMSSVRFICGTQDIHKELEAKISAFLGTEDTILYAAAFDANGGVEQFGYPISGFEYHENKIVQYFERARLEWQPWRAEGYRVVISDLGRAYFDNLGEDPALLAPASPLNNAPRVITELRIRAFVWKAVTLSNDDQMFFVIVQDQNAQPVSGASCTAVVNWPNGAKDSTIITSDTNGVGVVSLAFQNQPYGSLIYTDISCTYNNLTGKTTTSFRIWY